MKIDRLVSIIMLLLDKKRMGAQELADMFEVSPRTIYRDIDAINLAGIPIRSISGVGGGFEIMPEYKVDKHIFTTTDLSVILMGLSGLSNMIRGDELISALAKVKSFIPAEKAKDIEIAANQICIPAGGFLCQVQHDLLADVEAPIIQCTAVVLDTCVVVPWVEQEDIASCNGVLLTFAGQDTLPILHKADHIIFMEVVWKGLYNALKTIRLNVQLVIIDYRSHFFFHLQSLPVCFIIAAGDHAGL